VQLFSITEFTSEARDPDKVFVLDVGKTFELKFADRNEMVGLAAISIKFDRIKVEFLQEERVIFDETTDQEN
jgi:hypothetical protein